LILESLEAKVNGYLHGNARSRAVNEACGPFHIGFDAGNANPFLNYAVPEANAVVTSEDIEALLAAFAKRERTPRLEFAPGGAPGVEQALLAAGFEVQQRLPFMVVTAAELAGPAELDGIEVVVLDASASDEELRGVALAQREAFGDSDEPQDDADFSGDVAGLRASVEAGKFSVLARGAAGSAPAGVPMAGGGCGPAIAGTTEIGGIATRPAFRRRGAGAAVTAALSRHLLEAVGLDCVWLSPAGPDQERLYATAGYRSLGEMLFIWKP
jgi:ribosomal protein S18 acetylase RimI-like enzyme